MSVPFLEWDHIYDEKTWVLYAWLLKKTHNRGLSRSLIHRISSQLVLNDKKYNYNPQEWMVKWLSDPLLQKINPLYGMEENNSSMLLSIWLLVWYDKFPINIYNKPYHLEQSCSYIPIYNCTQTDNLIEVNLRSTADYLLGILVDDEDISKINNITITINHMVFTFNHVIDIKILETIEPIGDIDYTVRPLFTKLKKLFIVKELGTIVMQNMWCLIQIHTFNLINTKSIKFAWVATNPEYLDVLQHKWWQVGAECGEYIYNGFGDIYNKRKLNADGIGMIEKIKRYNATIKAPIKYPPQYVLVKGKKKNLKYRSGRSLEKMVNL